MSACMYNTGPEVVFLSFLSFGTLTRSTDVYLTEVHKLQQHVERPTLKVFVKLCCLFSRNRKDLDVFAYLKISFVSETAVKQFTP
jgi:hypothetical protein